MSSGRIAYSVASVAGLVTSAFNHFSEISARALFVIAERQGVADLGKRLSGQGQWQRAFRDHLGRGHAIHHEGIDAPQRSVLFDVAFIGADVDLVGIGQFAQQFLEVRPQVHRDRPALEAFGPGDLGFVARLHHHLRTVIDIGLGKDERLLAVGRDGDLVGDRVDAPRFQRADQPRERHGDEHDLVAGFLGDRVQKVHLEALQFVRAGEGEGEVASGHAHPDGLGGGGQGGDQRQGGGCGKLAHRKSP